MNLAKKLEEIERSYQALEAKLGDPEVLSRPQELQQLAKRHADLEDLMVAWREYQDLACRREDARELASSGDADMEALAEEELKDLEPLLKAREERIHFLLLPKDPDDEKSVIVEIRGGAGGDEAALFAASLYRMYSRYAERERWRVEILDLHETEIGGIKEVAFRIDGKGVFSIFM